MAAAGATIAVNALECKTAFKCKLFNNVVRWQKRQSRRASRGVVLRWRTMCSGLEPT